MTVTGTPRSARGLRWRRRLLQRVVEGWQTVRWPLLGGLAVVAFVLGHFGFREHFRLVGEPRSLARTFYLSLQLFTLESGSLAPPTPWQLDAARFLAPAVSFSTVATTLATIFREQFGLVRLRFFRGHVVICGLGQKGVRLANAFRDIGYRVVAIEREPTNGGVAECRRRGVVVWIGDATDPAVLTRARLRKAEYLIAVCGSDSVNAEVAVVARKVVRGRRGVLRAFVHIVDVALCGLLRERELAAQEEHSLRLEFFNIYESGSRELLRRFPPFSTPELRDSRPPHIVVVGLGQMGRTLVVQAAELWRQGRSGSEARLRVTAVERFADAKVDLLAAQYPGLQQIYDVHPVPIDIRSAAFEHGGFLADDKGLSDIDAVYVCVDDPGLGIDAGLALLRRISGRDVPVVVRTVQNSGLAALFAESADHDRLHTFSLLEETCTVEVLLGGVYELLARAIHADYLTRQRLEGHSAATNPAAVPWEWLSEQWRESNRDQAADIGAKLAAVGCGIEPLTDWDAELLAFSPEEVELLARMEHVRWMNHRREDGWRFLPGPKDEAHKTHPDLVPYEELTESKREYDRDTVRGIPAFLRRAGFRVTRLAGGSLDSGQAESKGGLVPR
jgi:hypothetical protein